jgi:HEAT repeat protein
MVNHCLRPLSHGRRAAISASAVLGVLLMVAGPVLGQGGRTLADWQHDLRDPAVDVRVRAAQALVAFDQRAVPILTGVLGDKEYRVRASATDALVKMPSSYVVPGMIEALRNADPGVRANAAVVLGAFGPAAKHAVPALASALKDPNLRVRELAGEALNRIVSPGPNQRTTLPLNCH